VVVEGAAGQGLVLCCLTCILTQPLDAVQHRLHSKTVAGSMYVCMYGTAQYAVS
jgi:hypothetical protein